MKTKLVLILALCSLMSYAREKKKDEPDLVKELAKIKKFATVEVADATMKRLKENSKIFANSSRHKWLSLPALLKGKHFSRSLSKHQAIIEFEVKKSGYVILAITDRWAGGGSGGTWQEEIISRKSLIKEGWKYIGIIKGSYGSSPHDDWELFVKKCKAGDKYKYRTEKYVAPVVIIR